MRYLYFIEFIYICEVIMNQSHSLPFTCKTIDFDYNLAMGLAILVAIR
jgi:hypothetical protein